MKNKRILSIITLVTMLMGISNFTVCGENTEIKGLAVASESGVNSGKYSVENLIDGNETTGAILNPILNAKIEVKLPDVGNVTSLKIAVNNFPGYRNIKKIGIKYNETVTSTVEVPAVTDGIQWVEVKTEATSVNEIIIEIIEVYDNNKALSGNVTEIVVYGNVASIVEGENEIQSETPRELLIGYDFDIRSCSQVLPDYGFQNAFDRLKSTGSGFGSVKGSYFVVEFHNPTDVNKFAIMSSINGDWATVKEVEFAVYNKEIIFRNKMKNPEPITSPIRHNIENIGEEQTIDLSGEKVFKNVTHLIIRFTDSYMNSSSSWGGFNEIVFSGVRHTNDKPTGEIIGTHIVSNTQIFCEMGFVDGEPTEDFMKQIPTRSDGAKFLLKAFGLFDVASGYQGTFNFTDAIDDAKNLNMLSYIYSYKSFGIQGTEDNKFKPNEPLTARAFYKMLLCMLGYQYNVDFTWENEQNLLHKLGIGNMINIYPFTMKDLCNSGYEALTLPKKDNGENIMDLLRSKGLVPDEVWAMHLDKQDIVTQRSEVTYEPDKNANLDSKFSFTLNDDPKMLSKTAFCYNAPFHYAGIYYGTLPESDPLSKRKEYGEALKKAGARSLRFPGGLTCHQYYIEGEKYAAKASDDISAFDKGMWGGLYNHKDPNNNWYVDFYNMLDFCKEYDIDLLFQINPSFYVDEAADRVRMAYKSNFATKRSEDDQGNQVLEMTPGYYDYNRIDEAAAQLARNIDRMLERGYTIKNWEFGNEDNFVNYSKLPLSDLNNPLSQDYIEATTKYARVIKARIPDAKIIVAHDFPFKKMMAPEDYALLSAEAVHYPFGNWTIPPDDEKNSGSRLVGTNEQNFLAYYSKEAMYKDIKNGNLLLSNTESMAWRFQGWDVGALQNTFAQALNVVHNWGEVVFDSGFQGNVMHDLESPWFGHVLYDVGLDSGDRVFKWTSGIKYSVHRDDVPAQFIIKDKYFFNPASRAFEMLGRHYGGAALDPETTNVGRSVSGYTSVKEGKLYITIANRLNETKLIQIKFPNLIMQSQEVSAYILQSDFLKASFEDEYNVFEDLKFKINGNVDDQNSYAVEFEAMPYSATHFTVDLKK